MLIPLLTYVLTACSGAPEKAPGKQVAPLPSKTEFSALSEKQIARYQEAILPLYEKQLVRTGFNGAIILAKNGQIVFEDYRGTYNFATGQPIDQHTAFHVASVSKTFTAMTILRLQEQGKLNIEDPVSKYLPGFPYAGINLRMLLSHRSGLPKYDLLMAGTRSYTTKKKNRRGRWVKHTVYVKDPISVTGMSTNEDVLNYFVRNKPAVEANPDRRYSYCNTNYALLALVVERISGQSFPQYLKENLFGPLGMEDSYVFSLADTGRYTPSYQYNKRPYPLEKLDAVYGDKNVYSTVRDLLKWDRALYQGTYVSQETLALAFEPQSHEHPGTRNYGLGWHLLVNPPRPTVVYHNGWWHGNNAAFRRLISDTATVIVLGNKFNPSIWRAGNLGIVFNAQTDTSEAEE